MPKRILLVDDDTTLCNELVDILRDEGHFVDAVSDSKSAEEYVKKDSYDLYIFDYKMENITGIDLLKILREKESKSPVLIVSGKPNLDKLLKKENVSQYVSGFINKPFDIEELIGRIRKL